MNQNEKRCLIDANSLKNNPKLYKYLQSLQKSEVHLKELTKNYSPINLGTQLETLIEQELISIDWERKVILIEDLSINKTLKKKDELGAFKREVPEYMQDEKIKINKPYIPKNKKE